MVQLQESFIGEIFFAGLGGGQDHFDATFEFVLRELLIDVLQIERIADKLFVDLAQELVAFKSTEPLNPSNLGMRVRRFVRKSIDFIRLVVAL